jgi:two-component system, NarL family, response regulator DevR
MPDSDVIRVFLLDDHEVVRLGLRDLLEATPDIVVVGESGSAQDAIARIPALHPHVAVLDGRLPDGSGIDVCREIRSVDPSIYGLILTSFNDDDAMFAATMAGASGYVLKKIMGNDLVESIRSVAHGHSLLDPSATRRVLERRSGDSDESAELRSLTEQERRILSHIAEGMTDRQIAEALHLAEATVKNYLSNILAKLGLERRTQAAVMAAELQHT